MKKPNVLDWIVVIITFNYYIYRGHQLGLSWVVSL